MGEMVENKRITYEVRSLRSLPPYLSRSACIIRAILEDQISELLLLAAMPVQGLVLGEPEVKWGSERSEGRREGRSNVEPRL